MPKIEIAKPFRLTLDNGSYRDFPAGEYDVEDAIAQHWFVKAHTRNPDAAPIDQQPTGESNSAPNTPVPYAAFTPETLDSLAKTKSPVVDERAQNLATAQAQGTEPASAGAVTTPTEPLLPSAAGNSGVVDASGNVVSSAPPADAAPAEATEAKSSRKK